MAPNDGATHTEVNCPIVTDRVLDDAMREGVRVIMLGARTDPANSWIRARVVCFEGGQVVEDVLGELDLRTGAGDVDEQLHRALRKVSAPPHVLVLWGGMARPLLARVGAYPMVAACRVLDLRRAALALRPAIRARASSETLLAAYRQGGVANPESPMDDRVINLWWAVLEEAQHRGWSWDDLIVRSSIPRSLGATGGVALDRRDLASLPDAPAVYRLLDAAGHVIYVGQTGNLRRRIASHLRPTDSPTPKTLELSRRTHALKYRRVGSELEARLYEDRWIRRWRPPMNKAIDIWRGRSRHRVEPTAIAVVVPSTAPNCVEIFGWRPLSVLWQLRVNAQCQPARRLRMLWAVLTGRQTAMTGAAGLTSWGRIGAEIAHRMFKDCRRSWTWLRPDSFPSGDMWITAVGHAVGHVVATGSREPVEYRWMAQKDVSAVESLPVGQADPLDRGRSIRKTADANTRW